MNDPDSASLIIVAVLFATVLLRLLLVGLVVWVLIPRRRTCPRCSEVTVPVLESTFLRFLQLERRWCMSCGWSGVARKFPRAGRGAPTHPTIPIASVMLLVVLASVSCRPPQEDRVAQLLANSAKWVDLSHSFDEHTIYWPTAEPFKLTMVSEGTTVSLLHFPGIDSSAAHWLVSQRKVHAVGIDTPSIDYGQSPTFDVHQILFAADIPAFENVANIEQVPETGAYVVGLPMKFAGGTGGPLRIVAALP